MDFDSVADILLALALTTPRIIGAFLMLPLLTQQTVPATVRNSFFVSLAIVVLPIAVAAAPAQEVGVGGLAVLLVKEIFIGIAIGFCFGMVFWAMGAAGNVIDTKVGATLAQIFDPIQGHQTSLTGDFLSQFAAWLFMASGGFLVFLDILMSSYALWPVTSFIPDIRPQGIHTFVGHFSYFATAFLVIAAPALVLMALVDLSLGLVNRYAPQLNVFALTLPIKAWISTWIILLMLGVLVEFVLDRIGVERGLLDLLDRTFGSR
ncbi:type III secretion system export apparatus subunit SctT [Coralloluteibacterium stylophorae]|uniref:Type III secretion system export apparatus subunit SctT n=1 Tax=Coralloluteibacterium stylophorae TaxID=1776034 RepID=A0AAP2CEF1_9GAMM|nr:type III secretion system export apparatus subunit SctT [Coralloluteibacterium stylophorae]MBS7458764.1 type III secretion system export apparatus subunit SctT [Coralloluteibacterium stylophorae]